MGITSDEFCRICDNYNSTDPKIFDNCIIVRKQLEHFLRKACIFGKINGKEVDIYYNAIKTKYNKYPRDGTEKGDSKLREDFEKGNKN